MQFPESWLREFCDPPIGTEALAELLTMSGFEVENLKPVAPPFSGVVVAEIVAAEPHPQAERLRVCRVRTGAGELLQIVCGAPNARAGLKAPLATVGAVLPGGARIGASSLRGVDSVGMLCSAQELGIDDDHAGLLELPADAPVGAELRGWMQLDDTVFTLKLTPNLAHGLSVFGIAREVAALTGAPLVTPAVEPVVPGHDARLPVQVQAFDLCGRFSGRIVRGIDPRARTPGWMVQRLARCGQRSVSALVDISNYVMFESGQPTHIFDRARIHDGLVVRWARDGETLKLLNGNTVALDPQVGVIADAQGVESLAGIMGGDATAVSDDTRDIYIEAAFWWPDAVAGRSRRFAFSTDAGHRFERGVDPTRTALQIERITGLVLDICGGSAGPLDDQVLRLPERAPVTLRVARAARVSGLPITQAQCTDACTRLALPFSVADGTITVTPPSWRFDIRIEEDLIEEVLRIVGYDKLPDTPPVAPITARVRAEAQRGPHALRHALAALDYQEAISYSFVEPRWEHELAGNADPIRVLNPIAAPLSVMRSSLVGSLVAVLRHNLARRQPRVRIFEVGRVFVRDAAAADGPLAVAGVRQPLQVAALAYGSAEPLQWGRRERAVDFFDIKSDVEAMLAPRVATFVPDVHPALHPGRCARVEIDGRAIGHVGELHPRWRQAYELPHAPVLFELDADALLGQPLPVAEALPRQQPVTRDIALVVRDAVPHDALVAQLVADPLLRSATLFDVYVPQQPVPGIGPGERSLALRLELLDPAGTLTDDRTDAALAAALQRVQSAFGARLRG